MNRICFFINNISHSGGTERVTSVIANELEKRGYLIHILSLNCNGKPFFELSKSIQVNRLYSDARYNSLRMPLTIVKLRGYIKKNNISVLINVESMLALYSIPALIGRKINHICWEHFNYTVNLGRISRDIARKLAARFCNRIITLTNQDKNLWLSNLKCNAEITCIPNPITISSPLHFTSEKKRIFLAIGRLTYQKGFDLLLISWKNIVEANPHWKLRIIGSGQDEIFLKDLCEKLNIKNSVEILPKTNDIECHYSMAAFFVMSSRFEGLPLVLIEAQSYGLPAISFDCMTGPRDIIEENITGWLCDIKKPNALEIALNNAICIFENDSERYANLSNRSILNAKQFSIERIIPIWENIINDVVHPIK